VEEASTSIRPAFEAWHLAPEKNENFCSERQEHFKWQKATFKGQMDGTSKQNSRGKVKGQRQYKSNSKMKNARQQLRITQPELEPSVD